MDKQQMIYKMQQLAHNQERIEAIFVREKDDHRAEIAKVKRIMYENFAELLESWLDQPIS
ncbi:MULTISPECIES: hypothetical protein [unclassified Enterococcus]|uniref:hypothetical protein n=1 Tax=unclassified Enterococcus TaxID=2608891 RepID=UPI001555A31B|nr:MULTISPECIES: hypothetical protein [unclassified Enterococcus]MBS7576161.1 hypothetical protein [Enterococcus sp. MMGLQ5-2]MBS7583394.1 hypothetical protein [Enterococcus sp. MMGLQ5-1]NPD11254.1 hypothetical protein [Enterococcus sp. MMGLQ5-1]NPD35997.1 hypothetical protein [Enterococcus sp. MMGLQ5-2]